MAYRENNIGVELQTLILLFDQLLNLWISFVSAVNEAHSTANTGLLGKPGEDIYEMLSTGFDTYGQLTRLLDFSFIKEINACLEDVILQFTKDREITFRKIFLKNQSFEQNH